MERRKVEGGYDNGAIERSNNDERRSQRTEVTQREANATFLRTAVQRDDRRTIVAPLTSSTIQMAVKSPTLIVKIAKGTKTTPAMDVKKSKRSSHKEKVRPKVPPNVRYSNGASIVMMDNEII